MSDINSHYVPQLVLRRFGNKLCLFNVKTGEYKEEVNIDKAFVEKGFYTSETEKKLNERIESQFGNLFNNKLKLAESTLELTREELYLVKKFLLVSVIRSYGNEEFMQKEKHFYDNALLNWRKFALAKGLPEDKIKEAEKEFKAPFEEKQIDGETSFDYWMRTLNVVLDTNGTVKEIYDHPNKTYPAYRWAEVINNGYLAFWDSEQAHDEFVITDIGMTSENEKGWDGIVNHNKKKTTFLNNLLKDEKSKEMQLAIMKYLYMHRCFTENFMMFPISANRMIVEIDPFFKFRIMYAPFYKMPLLSELTFLDNESLYFPNDVKYVKEQTNQINPIYDDGDKYIYKIKKLTSKETAYCNALFMDRINTYLGFNSLNKIVKSVSLYKKLNSLPFKPRVDYTELYEEINKRFSSNIDLSTIVKVRDFNKFRW
ncbi:MAG: DUF4238 domain-containing protein [Bacilli bacterium]|nr:DUF4238 domain-containing protein [Bacilli bacterium]